MQSPFELLTKKNLDLFYVVVVCLFSFLVFYAKPHRTNVTAFLCAYIYTGSRLEIFILQHGPLGTVGTHCTGSTMVFPILPMPISLFFG